MKNLLFPFLCFGICFSQSSAFANPRAYSDEEALQTIMNSSSESNRYYVKTSSKEIERSYRENSDKLKIIQKRYPNLKIESANELYSLEKVSASFPPIPFRMIEA